MLNDIQGASLHHEQSSYHHLMFDGSCDEPKTMYINADKVVNKSFIHAWKVIDGVIDQHVFFEQEIRDQVGDIGCNESIQMASEWALEFQKVYRRIAKYPNFRDDINKQLKIKSAVSGLRFACNWFASFEREYLRLNISYLTIESGDDSIVEEARITAMKCERSVMENLKQVKSVGLSGDRAMDRAIYLLESICSGAGVDMPKSSHSITDNKKEAIAAMCTRLFDEKWWRRQLRKLQARKLENAARYFGMVCKNRGGYCSVPTLKRRYAQKSRNDQLLKMMEAENDEGKVYTLAELSELGVSNPVKRRAELMTRLSGFGDVAKEVGGYTAVFITQTSPSRYHSHNRSGIENKHWDGSTPREAQKYFTDVWARVRADFAREGIEVFGFRVCEPHHDGCPHWHMLLWFLDGQVDEALKIYQDYSMEDEPPVKGREEVRFKVKRDFGDAGGAISYIAKYISKNVDGLREDGTAWSADVVKTAVRTEAWASTYGIRQFQQIGGASVTVWREVRRLGDEVQDESGIEEIRACANSGNWCGFTMAMGGVVMPRKDRPLRAFMVAKKENGQKLKNAYGEFMNKIRGLMAYGFLPVITRVREWIIRPIKREVDFIFEVGDSPPLDLCQ
jgi:hypothetical protein